MAETPRPGPAPRWRAGPSYFSLSGLERVRSFSTGELPMPAAYRTVGMRPLRVEHGGVSYELAPSGWLAGRDGTVATGAIAFFMDAPVTNPVHSTIPGGTAIRTVRLSLDFHAPLVPGAGPFVGEGTILGIRDGIGVGSATMAAADGTPLAASTCRTVLLDGTGAEGRVDEPVPADDGPDPIDAPVPVSGDADRDSGLSYLERGIEADERPPFWVLLGCHTSEAEQGRVVLTMPADPWLGTHVGILYGGVTASFGVTAAEAAMWSGDGEGERTRVLSYTHDFTRMVYAGETVVIAEARLVHRGRTLAVADVELLDADGRRVGLGRSTGLVGTVGP